MVKETDCLPIIHTLNDGRRYFMFKKKRYYVDKSITKAKLRKIFDSLKKSWASKKKLKAKKKKAVKGTTAGALGTTQPLDEAYKYGILAHSVSRGSNGQQHVINRLEQGLAQHQIAFENLANLLKSKYMPPDGTSNPAPPADSSLDDVIYNVVPEEQVIPDTPPQDEEKYDDYLDEPEPVRDPRGHLVRPNPAHPLAQLRRGQAAAAAEQRMGRNAQVLANIPEQAQLIGDGKGTGTGGLYDDQINHMMESFPEFFGTIASDEVHLVKPFLQKHNRLGFIINLDPHNKPGYHWCAVYIDYRPQGTHSVEWFNPYGEPIPRAILQRIKNILPHGQFLKFKQNMVKQQSEASSNCGFFSMEFLIKRFQGKNFREATGWDDNLHHHAVMKDEAEIERLKRMPPFNYIHEIK